MAAASWKQIDMPVSINIKNDSLFSRMKQDQYSDMMTDSLQKSYLISERFLFSSLTTRALGLIRWTKNSSLASLIRSSLALISSCPVLQNSSLIASFQNQSALLKSATKARKWRRISYGVRHFHAINKIAVFCHVSVIIAVAISFRGKHTRINLKKKNWK